MSLRIYSSNRMELLVEYLAQALGSHPLPPLVPETVVVQSQGMVRWLAMELARRTGVWANGTFPFPNAFLRQVFAEVLTKEPHLDNWQRPMLAWRIMELLPELSQDAAFQQVAVYATTPLKSRQLAAAMADLFDQYMIYRPDMIKAWEAGEEPLFWQAVLWRRLVGDINRPHRAQLFERCLAQLRRPDCDLGALPSRVSIFGISSMPPLHLEVLTALGRHLEVNMFFLNPCAREWGDIIPEAAISRLERSSGQDRQAHFLDLPTNPLLASMGRLGRDFFSMLLDSQAEEQTLFLEPEATTLLTSIQTDILNLTDAGPGHDRDDSILFISCHSPMREVEVLHDHILGLFAAEGGLEPRDILVMAPDISLYAPLIQAVFAAEGDQLLPFGIADQSRVREECVAGFFQVLRLARSRFKILDLMALLETAALRRRFQLSLDDITLINEWLGELRIRWGRHGRDRVRFGLPPHEENSWQAGLDRLLLGFAMGEEQLFAGILPFDGAHLEPETAGRLLNFYHTLSRWTDRLQQSADLPTWSRQLLELVAELFEPDQDEEQQLQALRTALAGLETEAVLAELSLSLDLEVVENRVQQAMGQELSPYGFMGGGITFCSLLPMRAVPFKVVCLLGMNDGDFPRSPARFNFDLLGREFRRGDRSMRFDDRYLFLEALLSARRQLYISYLGRSIVDDSEQAPSVLVHELMEYTARMLAPATATARDTEDIQAGLVISHHLQPFHAAYFQTDRPSYSAQNFQAAQALADQARQRVNFCRDLPLPRDGEEKYHLSLTEFQRFWQSPSRFFCEQRLGLHMEAQEEASVEDEPFSLQGLDRYGLRRDLVHGLLADKPPSFAMVRARGILPHGAMAQIIYDETLTRARGFVDQVRALGGGEMRTVIADLALPPYTLAVELTDINSLGQFHYRFGKMDGRHLLRTWISHLVLNCLDLSSATGRSSLLIADNDLLHLPPLPEAQPALLELLTLFSRGHQEPLPFFARASWVFVTGCRKQSEDKALAAAATTLWGDEYTPGECRHDPALGRCYPEGTELGEEFVRLARAVYGPLEQAMRTG